MFPIEAYFLLSGLNVIFVKIIQIKSCLVFCNDILENEVEK